MKTYSITLIIILYCNFSFAQPSMHMGVRFKKLKNEKLVTYDSIALNYMLLDEGNNVREIKSDGNWIFFSGEVVYNNLVRKFVFEKDTMSLEFKNHLMNKSEVYSIETLVFKKGKYIIHENDIEKIDFEKSATNYYNMQIKLALKLQKMRPDFEDLKFYKELNLLKREYNIAIDDYAEKTKIQLFGKPIKK